MKWDLVLYPNEILGKHSTEFPIGEIKTEKFLRLISAMFSTMYKLGGVGLAAPQVGINHRLLIGNSNSRDTHNSTSFVLINPTIVPLSGEITMMEGCLSIPDIYLPVTRPDVISVRTLDILGQEKTFEARGFISRIIQHEMDHLDGLTLLDRAKPSDIERIKPQLEQHIRRVQSIQEDKDKERKRRKKG